MKAQMIIGMSSLIYLAMAVLINAGDRCKKPTPLGMENRQILDAQITASSAFDANHGATNGRLNFQANGGKTGAWSARTNDVNQWLKVDFKQNVVLTGIKTQGRGNCACDQWVTSYTISFSSDNVNYKDYTENGNVKVFSGNNDKNSIVDQVVWPHIFARYIRVHPKTWHGHISMRVEFIGCLTELPAVTCDFLKARGHCTDGRIQAKCPSRCPQASCTNYMSDSGCDVISNAGDCPSFFPLCRKKCFKCDRLYEPVGCYIDQNGDRIMSTYLGAQYGNSAFVNVCAGLAADRGFSVFGVEADGQCFSGPNAYATYKKHGKAPDAECLGKGLGTSHRMNVYRFV